MGHSDASRPCNPREPQAAQAAHAATGITWGGRVLAQLVAGVEELVGPQDAPAALASLRVIVAVDDEVQAACCKDLWAHKFYGLRRENVLLVMQARRPAHAWNAAAGMFEEDEHSDTFAPGSGVSLMQVRPGPSASPSACVSMRILADP